MINRKLATLALFAVIAAPSAFAANVDTSDGRQGGAFWNQPIVTSASITSLPRVTTTVGEANLTDGDQGGTYWTSKVAAQSTVAADEQFVATAQASSARPFAFLEDYNN